jgi:hypothetical protein
MAEAEDGGPVKAIINDINEAVSTLPLKSTKKILDKLRVEREAQSVRINKWKEGMGRT